jgi:cytochrome c-type biogenesis protein CcmE
MKSRHQRLVAIGLVVAGVGLGATFLLKAMNQNILYYYSPTQLEEGMAPEDRRFRVGGLVVDNSIARTDGTMEVRFVLTDEAHTVPVVYSGILPDLFREGQGIIAHGRMQGKEFVADEILAKHDENYMPPEVAASLNHTRAQQDADTGAYGSGK